MLDKIKEDLKKAITEFTIEDFNIYTMNELYMQISNKTNEVIEIVKLLQDYLDEQIFNDVENIEIKQQTLENVFNQLIINAGNSNAEIVDARVEADGTTHSKLGNRLNKIDSQIKDIVTVKLQDFEGDNDTQKLKNLINYVDTNLKNTHCNILINLQNKLTITEDLVIEGWSNKKIEILSKLKFDNCSALEFRWLKDSVVTILDVEGDITKSNDNLSTLTQNGLKFTNCNSNIIDIVKIAGFRDGLILHGKDYSNGQIRGCYGNKVTFKSISKCYNALVLSDDKGDGWVNENNIYGGGIYATNGLVQGDPSQTTPTTSKFHNNKFYHIEFEQIYGGTVITFYQGRNCVIQHPRFEGSGIGAYSKYFVEYAGACDNILDSTTYIIPTNKIELNLNRDGSTVIGDIRYEDTGTKVANKMVATTNGYRYIDYYNENSFINTWSKDIPNNTVCLGMGDGIMLAKKDGGEVHKLHCSSVQYFKDNSLMNGFTNFSSTTGSTSPNVHCYKTGNNEIVVGGLIKCDSKPSAGTVIFKLPTGFECDTKCEFLVSCEVDTGDVFSATVEIEWNQVRLRKFSTNSSTFTKVTRLCLNGIRFKKDIKTVF